MIYKYFRFTKARVIGFCFMLAVIFGGQYFLTGSLLAPQQVTTEAGNSNSAVIGILPNTEVIRQKFCFDRRVVLNAFSISFGSFKKKEVGTLLHVQLLDGNNDAVYEQEIPVEKIKPNAALRIKMDKSVVIPKGVTCCIRLTCSSKNLPYATIPTVNTTNRTDPNTYMSTITMQTHAKSVNISYSYSFRQLYPLVMLIVEVLALFIIFFERITEYSKGYYKKLQKEKKKGEHSKRLSRKSVGNFLKWFFSDPSVLEAVRLIMLLINPIILAMLLENMNGTLLTIAPNVWIFTWILLGAIQLIFMTVIPNAGIAVFVMDVAFFIFGLGNLLVMTVRGTPLLPADILGINTAAEVASTYTFSLAPSQFVVLPEFIIWCALLLRTRKKGAEKNWKKLLLQSGLRAVAGCCLIGVLYHTSILDTFGIRDSVWNKVSSCRTNGFYMNFFLNMHYLKVDKPGDYSHERVAELLKETETTDVAEAVSSSGIMLAEDEEVMTNAAFHQRELPEGKKPNIILIMNESLADFSLVGNVNYNRDPLPFIHSMKKNTIKGKNYVSVFGAGTSNSEFEAMTGNSMEFFPSGCNVYQQFTHDSTFSLPSYLKEQGYRCEAVHPSSGANWNRVAAYHAMKFDEFVTIEKFKKPEYVRYISDKESYKKVIELYEKKGNKPLYVFDMTIQNHGGYLTNTDWKDPVYVQNSYLTEAKEYLSATYVSDQAFEYLINYFSKQKEPTIICMFGDHFPSIEPEFYESLLGKPETSWKLTDLQKRYAVPFIIWANYDIEESDNAMISNNYLENMLLKQSGIELPKYNQFVEKVSKTIPAMNVNGYMDTDGSWRNYDDEQSEEVKELLNDYKVLQYGYYSDMDKKEMGKLFQMKP